MKFRKPILALLAVFALLAIVYAPTMLKTINGSSDDFMADTAETQIVLNVWGTLHATGYPLFTILGNLLVSALKFIGISPMLAPSLVSLIFGCAALAIVFVLALHFTQRVLLAAMATLLFGLTRYVWIHNVIPEVYTFTLLLLVVMFAIAVWRDPIPHRLEWLALVGGIAIAHHRAPVLAIIPLFFAVRRDLVTRIRQRPQLVVTLFLLGVIGFVPYIYLPLRAHTGATWVYGDPGSLSGFWDQFIARENPTIVRVPASLDIVLDKLNVVNTALVTDLTLPGILLGIVGLAFAIWQARTRDAAITFAIGGITAYAFVVILFDDILAPVIFPITLALMFGWVFLADAILTTQPRAYIALVPLAMAYGFFVVPPNSEFIANLTHDTTAQETIALAQNAPAGSTFLLTWGTRYYAIGFAQEVLGQLKQLQRADDKADLAAILARRKLVMPEFILIDRPPSWFEKKLGARVYVRAIAPHLVEIATTPERAPSTLQAYDDALPIAMANPRVRCFGDTMALQVDWVAMQKPSHAASVFVHLLDANGNILAQADQAAPVYGWRPLPSWNAGELVRDLYPLPRLSNAITIRFGLYEKLSNGEFKNYRAITVPAQCDQGD